MYASKRIHRVLSECTPYQTTRMSKLLLGNSESYQRAGLRNAWLEFTCCVVLTCNPKTAMAWWVYRKHSWVWVRVYYTIWFFYTFSCSLSVRSLFKDYSWEKGHRGQRSLQTKHLKPWVWKVKCCWVLYTKIWQKLESHSAVLKIICVLQDVWAILLPTARKGPENQCLWLRFAKSWWKSWGHGYWPWKSLPFTI